jgi:D-threo-aldose 1-dehydrogenase
LGCSGLGGLYKPLSQEDAVAVVRAAVSVYGIQTFDTAPHYGTIGVGVGVYII